ncbi:unnamed protein product [Gulo gulo]|uniref:Uncharacterized protein n=1 Tax=Gulo gulo TaxID=48420 RepID=A0A9X9LSZ9_GULGU|nr:unnamed protein product [Gulo gulo]
MTSGKMDFTNSSPRTVVKSLSQDPLRECPAGHLESQAGREACGCWQPSSGTLAQRWKRKKLGDRGSCSRWNFGVVMGTKALRLIKAGNTIWF